MKFAFNAANIEYPPIWQKHSTYILEILFNKSGKKNDSYACMLLTDIVLEIGLKINGFDKKKVINCVKL